MKEKRLVLDITDLPLSVEALQWLKDVLKNEQNKAIKENEIGVADYCMDLLVVVSYLITSLDRPIKGHFVLDQ